MNKTKKEKMYIVNFLDKEKHRIVFKRFNNQKDALDFNKKQLEKDGVYTKTKINQMIYG